MNVGPVRSVPRVEAMADPWQELRLLRQTVSPGEVVRVRYGARGPLRLSSTHVRNLLRLAGFEPGASWRVGDGREMSATAVERSVRACSCTVVVPCRNEVENVAPLLHRVPELGTRTEIIYVDGDSTDGTPERVQALIEEHPDRHVRLLHQRGGGGKAAAVFQGFDAADGDIVLILDADMTVAPEDLPRFVLALTEGVGDFANGSRFAFPMESQAMRPLNNAGNRLFGTFFSWALSTPVTDTLCGTKALFKRDWERIRAERARFGGHDPWGDFDLLFGASYLGMSIVEVPVRYWARTAGESKMHAFAHGATLARTCVAGVRVLKSSGRFAGR